MEGEKMTRDLPESRLFEPVRQWLSAMGYKVFGEFRGHDVAAIREGHVVIVELKMTCSRRLIGQTRTASIRADAAYGAVPRMPRATSVEKFARSKLGLLTVVDGVVTVVCEPERQCIDEWRMRRILVDQLTKWDPDDRIGGVPTLAGDGDAQRVVRRVAEYRTAHPCATWKDIYRDVPNHYAHARSMQGAMREAVERQTIRRA